MLMHSCAARFGGRIERSEIKLVSASESAVKSASRRTHRLHDSVRKLHVAVHFCPQEHFHNLDFMHRRRDDCGRQRVVCVSQRAKDYLVYGTRLIAQGGGSESSAAQLSLTWWHVPLATRIRIAIAWYCSRVRFGLGSKRRLCRRKGQTRGEKSEHSISYGRIGWPSHRLSNKVQYTYNLPATTTFPPPSAGVPFD